MEEMYSVCYLQTLNQPIISQLHPTIEDNINIALNIIDIAHIGPMKWNFPSCKTQPYY